MLWRPSKYRKATIVFAALDSLATKVMVADAAQRITYLNPALKQFLKEAQRDFRETWPTFDAARLIGCKLDLFYKTFDDKTRDDKIRDDKIRDDKIRDARASTPKTAVKPDAVTIRVGQRLFDLLVTPLTDRTEAIGYVVEWNDAAERSLTRDYSNQIMAIGRSHMVVEFRPDGTIAEANQNFLDVMGYRLEEVQNRHHSIFVEPAFRSSETYLKFWDDLRAGHYQKSQFKRIGKTGQAVWIEGSYDPVVDSNGKISKIIKYAIDVTEQVHLLSKLKALIDENFSEVDRAVIRTNSESHQATEAAGKTSHSVKSVAAAAERLATSISEIAADLIMARGASDEAHDRSQSAGDLTQELVKTATAMSGIVDLIQRIASQINLLSLNATIESARAGEAGRGFAVVAQEVKTLANQASLATHRITGEIKSVQQVSKQVVESLGAIQRSVQVVRDHVMRTATSVEEQSSVTQDVSINMHGAAGAVNAIAENIIAISGSVASVSSALDATKQAVRVLAR